jgi:hypothetical protein
MVTVVTGVCRVAGSLQEVELRKVVVQVYPFTRLIIPDNAVLPYSYSLSAMTSGSSTGEGDICWRGAYSVKGTKCCTIDPVAN